MSAGAPITGFMALDPAVAARLDACLDAAALASTAPRGLHPGPSPWDAVQQRGEMEAHQSDCNWFAFEARDVDASAAAPTHAGILALHRTGARLTALDGGSPASLDGAPPSLRAALQRGLGSLLPVRPSFDPRPLFLSVLYDRERARAATFERAVEGAFDPARFAFTAHDGAQQIVSADARTLGASLPASLAAFFDYVGPGFALRTVTDEFSLELFLRPRKDAVAYGDPATAAIRGDGVVIHYVQRPRLDLVGLLRRRGDDAPRVLTGDATQDRHWMTMTNPALRWLWLMARLPDGRDVMAFEMRSAGGGRHAPADAGRPAGGGAWLVEADGRVRAIASWSLRPEAHVDTPRGRVPRRFRVRLQDDGLDVRLVLRHRQPTFVPTRALGELYDAGIWESPCDVESAEGVGEGGRYWVDVMTPGGGV